MTEQAEQELWNEIYYVLNLQSPSEEIDIGSFTYASSKRRVDEIMDLIKSRLQPSDSQK